MSTIPKAILYYHPLSVWCAVALLALEEKGYGEDEIDRRIVDLAKGENYDPSFLRLNPQATVPTLVVPLAKTLTEDVESRYKAITDTKRIIEFLDKSRSPMSRTHTTSSAPAPSLTPATIAFSATSKIVIEDIIHSDDADPNNLWYLNARNEASLRSVAEQVLPLTVAKQETLARHSSKAESGQVHVSEKVKNLWREKKIAAEVLSDVLVNANKTDADLDADAQAKRAEYFRMAHDAWEIALKDILNKLNKEIIGPYVLGDQFSLADLHLAGWAARVVTLAGGTIEDDGNTAIGKLEIHIGNGFALPRESRVTEGDQKDHPVNQNKLAVFWDAVRERSSWKKVYANGLY